jgi:NAD+ synthetase
MADPSQRPPLRAALVQLRPQKGRVRQNLEKVAALVSERAGTHDLMIFPETCLSGYFVEGGVAEAARGATDVAAALGAPAPGAPDVVLGFYERWRRRLYNSVAWLTPVESGWEVLHVHRKMFLPTYGIFDEERFVEAGRELVPFDTRFGRVGMLVCEEMWHSLPPTILALGGAELIAVVSASPARDFNPGAGRPGNLERWERLAPAAAVEHGIFVLVSQLVGSEGGKIFPGGSLAVAPDGEVLARGPLLEEGVTEAILDGSRIDRARFDAPLLADLEQKLPYLRRALDHAVEAGRTGKGAGGNETEAVPFPELPPDDAEAVPPVADGAAEEVAVQPPPALRGGEGSTGLPDGRVTADPDGMALDLELVERALVGFIREEVVLQRGFEKVVLGVSGGVDSAVSLHLACRALGPENVYGFRLPYRTSSAESLDHAARVLEETGAQARTVDISEPVDAYVREYEPEISPLRKGNLMARLRAVILFDQSARLHALPLGTGNKSERLLGYFTWHADDSPPINPLGDLFKTQVWALARHLGVPEEIVEKPATADLVKGVTDEDELGISYHEADPILHWFVKGYRPEDLVRQGFEPEAVRLVWNRLGGTHWKRELPTVAVLSSSAIGEFYLRPVDY